MKKIILLPALFLLIFFGTTTKLYAQTDLQVVNNSTCAHNLLIWYDDGTGICGSRSVTVPASTTITYASVWGGNPGEFCDRVEIVCNPCPSVPMILGAGPFILSACTGVGYPVSVNYICATCALNWVNYVFTAPGAGNAVLTITPI